MSKTKRNEILLYIRPKKKATTLSKNSASDSMIEIKILVFSSQIRLQVDSKGRQKSASTSSSSVSVGHSWNCTLGACWSFERLSSILAFISSNDLREFLFSILLVATWML